MVLEHFHGELILIVDNPNKEETFILKQVEREWLYFLVI